jgi:hypothetical protein
VTAPARRYLLTVLALSGGVLSVIVGLNLLLGARGAGSAEVTRLASEWQQATRGVTYAPPYTDSRPFKRLRLADRLAEVNALVLGDSMMMGITGSLFPEGVRAYNFSLTANPTAMVVGEFEYVERRLSSRIRVILAGLDWPIGMMYLSTGVPAMDLGPATASVAAAPAAPLSSRLADALSRPKVASLIEALRYVIGAVEPVRAFRATFLEVSGLEYRCGDGALARDFDVVRRGTCLGFRYDGSWTFAGERRLDAAGAAVLARAAAAPSSKFSQSLQATDGRPNAEVLRRLGDAAARFVRHGGYAVFLLPPLIPGMERAMLENPGAAERLMRTKTILDDWGRSHGVTVIDAGASERFGCAPGDFLDENHAYPACHERVLGRFWRDRAAGRVAPGLYRP